MPFLPPNQQRQSTEGTVHLTLVIVCDLKLYSADVDFSDTNWQIPFVSEQNREYLTQTYTEMNLC